MSKPPPKLNEKESLVIKFFEDNDIEYDDKKVISLCFKLIEIRIKRVSFTCKNIIIDEDKLKGNIRKSLEDKFNKKLIMDDLLNYILS